MHQALVVQNYLILHFGCVLSFPDFLNVTTICEIFGYYVLFNGAKLSTIFNFLSVFMDINNVHFICLYKIWGKIRSTDVSSFINI